MIALEALALTSWSSQIRESVFLYPWIQTLHLFSVCAFLAPAVVADLMILKAWKSETLLLALVKHNPFQYLALFMILLSGSALFLALPERTFHSLWFRGKMLFLLIALANGLYIKTMLKAKLERNTIHELKKFAILSLFLWTIVICLGNLIPYRWLDCEFINNPILKALTQCR